MICVYVKGWRVAGSSKAFYRSNFRAMTNSVTNGNVNGMVWAICKAMMESKYFEELHMISDVKQKCRCMSGQKKRKKSFAWVECEKKAVRKYPPPST